MNITNQQFIDALASDNPSKVKEAMLYTLLAPSKQLRAQLLFSVLNDYGVDQTLGLDAAIALECIQAYSLIHDDLPSMDNDQIRRNQPTNHLVYGEAIALLAGDGLNNKAFEILAHSNYQPEVKVQLIQVLAQAAGISGMIYGQLIDMLASEYVSTYDDVSAMYSYKTGKLFSAAAMMGAIIANKSEDMNRWQNIGEALGLAFQIQDDLLEATISETQLGKSKSDQSNDKATMIKIIGIDKAKQVLNVLFEDIFEAIGALSGSYDQVIELITRVKNRDF